MREKARRKVRKREKETVKKSERERSRKREWVSPTNTQSSWPTRQSSQRSGTFPTAQYRPAWGASYPLPTCALPSIAFGVHARMMASHLKVLRPQITWFCLNPKWTSTNSLIFKISIFLLPTYSHAKLCALLWKVIIVKEIF